MNKLLLIIIVILSIFGLFLGFSKTTLNQQETPEELIIPTTEEQPNKISEIQYDDYAKNLEDIKWVEYKNTEMGFSLSYPSNLESLSYAETGSSVRIDENPSKDIALDFTVFNGMGYLAKVTYYKIDKNNFDNWVSTLTLTDLKPSKMPFKGFDAYFYGGSKNDQVPTDSYVFLYKDYGVMVQALSSKFSTQMKNTIVDKIITSLKFD